MTTAMYAEGHDPEALQKAADLASVQRRERETERAKQAKIVVNKDGAMKFASPWLSTAQAAPAGAGATGPLTSPPPKARSPDRPADVRPCSPRMVPLTPSQYRAFEDREQTQILFMDEKAEVAPPEYDYVADGAADFGDDSLPIGIENKRIIQALLKAEQEAAIQEQNDQELAELFGEDYDDAGHDDGAAMGRAQQKCLGEDYYDGQQSGSGTTAGLSSIESLDNSLDNSVNMDHLSSFEPLARSPRSDAMRKADGGGEALLPTGPRRSPRNSGVGAGSGPYPAVPSPMLPPDTHRHRPANIAVLTAPSPRTTIGGSIADGETFMGAGNVSRASASEVAAERRTDAAMLRNAHALNAPAPPPAAPKEEAAGRGTKRERGILSRLAAACGLGGSDRKRKRATVAPAEADEALTDVMQAREL